MLVFAKVIPKTLLVPFFSGHGVEPIALFAPIKWLANIILSKCLILTGSVERFGGAGTRW